MLVEVAKRLVVRFDGQLMARFGEALWRFLRA
jgi:hypothetical protein